MASAPPPATAPAAKGFGAISTKLQDIVAQRPAAGSVGEKRTLTSNFFPLRLGVKKVFRYLVEFNPEIPQDEPQRRRIALGKFQTDIKEKLGIFAFDGIGLIGLKNPPPFQLDVEGQSINLSLTKEIEMTNVTSEEVQMLANIMVKQLFRTLKLVQLGKNYYHNKPQDIGDARYHMLPGFSASITPTLNNTMQMTIDICHRVLYKQHVRHWMNVWANEVQQLNRGKTPAEMNKLVEARWNEELGGRSMMTLHGYKKIYRVDHVDMTKNIDQTFIGRDGKPVSFRNYFKSTYQIDWKMGGAQEAKALPGLLAVRVKARAGGAPAPSSAAAPAAAAGKGAPAAAGKAPSSAAPVAPAPAPAPVAAPSPSLEARGHTTERKKGERADAKEGQDWEYIYLPAELCYLTGMTDEIRADRRLMDSMSRMTRKRPEDRFQLTTALVKQMMTDPTTAEAVQRLGLKIDLQPQEVKSRTLGAVKIETGGASFVPQKRGAFNFHGEIRAEPFTKLGLKPELSAMAIVFPPETEKMAHEFAGKLSQTATQQGGKLPKAAMVQVPIPSTSKDKSKVESEWRRVLESVLQSAPFRAADAPKAIIFFNPGGNEYLYSLVKQVLSVERGILSQGVKPETLMPKVDHRSGESKPMMPAVCGNLFKQVMSKVGAVNWHANIPSSIQQIHPAMAQPTMVVGMDVCHDAKTRASFGYKLLPKSSGAISTVGFCASFDPHHTRFLSWVSMQGRYEECVSEAKRLMKEALQGFHQRNGGKFPQNVVVFRDGVGTSQIKNFVMTEVGLFKAAARELGINVKFTVVVVQKKVTARFFMRCGGQRCEFNHRPNESIHTPPASSVIDSDVGHPGLFDFYTVATGAPPGTTAQPCRYIVVTDDMRFTADGLQLLAHKLCYQYLNWPGPIKVPAPVMYAHKIAYLFGKLLYGVPHANLQGKLHYL